MMTYHSKILVICFDCSGEYSLDESFIICDGYQCVLYHLYDESMESTRKESSSIFDLTIERKELYSKSFKVINNIYLNEENHRQNPRGIKIKIVDNNKDNQTLFNCQKGAYRFLRDFLIDSPYFDEKPILALLSIFLPKALWFERLNRLEKDGELQPLVDNALTMIKKEIPELSILEFGRYPQELENDIDIINELNNLYSDLSKWNGFSYNARDYIGEYMFYIDIRYKSDIYRGIYLKRYRPTQYGDNIARDLDSTQKENGFKLDTIYWYKYLPIKWYIFENDNHNILISKNVIDAEAYNEDDGGYPSEIEIMGKYLNEMMMPIMFNDIEKKQILENISIPSIEEFESLLPLRSLRKPIPTDYSYIRGFMNYKAKNWVKSFIWSSTSMGEYTHRKCVIDSDDGSVVDRYDESNRGYLTFVNGGIEPKLVIKKIKE